MGEVEGGSRQKGELEIEIAHEFPSTKAERPVDSRVLVGIVTREATRGKSDKSERRRNEPEM